MTPRHRRNRAPLLSDPEAFGYRYPAPGTQLHHLRWRRNCVAVETPQDGAPYNLREQGEVMVRFLDDSTLVIVKLHELVMAGPSMPSWDDLHDLEQQRNRLLDEIRRLQGNQKRAADLHWRAKFTDISLGIKDMPVCAICHAVMDEPADWPEDGPDWPYPLVQEPWPCQTRRILGGGT